jgi:LysM repeat protein
MHPIFVAATALVAPLPFAVGAMGIAQDAPRPPDPARAEQTVHVVQPGDTLTAIAAEHDRTVAAIVLVNGIADPDAIAVGAILVIPPPPPRDATLHVVEEGDALAAIADLYAVDVDALARANDLTLETLIFPGDVLIVP